MIFKEKERKKVDFQNPLKDVFKLLDFFQQLSALTQIN